LKWSGRRGVIFPGRGGQAKPLLDEERTKRQSHRLRWGASGGDVDPGNRSRVNESLHPARLGRVFTMKRTRHTAEQIIRKLKTAEQLIAQGKTVADVCRVIEVTQPTYHRWRQQYGGMQAEEARRLTQLEKENARLKKLLAEAELEKAMLKDLAEGNF
jgi:transposase-like protein